MEKTIAVADDAASTSRLSDGCRPSSRRGAETPISLLDEKVDIVVGDPHDRRQAACQPVRKVFDDTVLAFFDDLSRSLFGDTACRRYSDVVTFAFWCRKSALAKQRALYANGNPCIGRGCVFHISPANVPIMFAYTLAVGLLSGNANIVRLPSRAFPQVDFLCRRIDAVVRREAHRNLLRYVTCVRYDHNEVEITRLLSQLCDVRVIWGGDNTIREIRKIPLKAGAFDVVFPDRYSVAVIDSDAWLKCEDQDRQIRGFYNDTYLSDQGACSSPRLVLWLGSRVEQARARFWDLLEELVMAHAPSTAQALRKLEYTYWILARHPGSELSSENLKVMRIWCNSLDASLFDDHPGGGVFVESSAASLDELLPLLRRRCQTISYYGVPVDQLASLLYDAGPRGGHRVVPIGRTLDFSLTWDGHDTIRTLSRRLEFIGAAP